MCSTHTTVLLVPPPPLLLVHCAGGPHRKLAQWGGGWRGREGNIDNSQRAINTVRSQAATSQAILEAVNTGGSLPAVASANRVGSVTAWAVAQPNQDIANAVLNFSPFGRR